MSNLEIIHVVKRYGLVGGMEGYVWELTHALLEAGLKIGVICEKVYGSPSQGIAIHTVDIDKSPSRWKAMMGFRNRVDELIKNQFSNQKIIIHSHERTLNHQVTTFHGPPMVPKKDWWRFPKRSIRVKAWQRMEKDEILGPIVQFVLPVSNQIKDQLINTFPEVQEKNVVVAYPGVKELENFTGARLKSEKIGARFVFVGKEWKRKGLELAIKIIDDYSEKYSASILDVYGPNRNDLPRFVSRHANIQIKGWSDYIPWHTYDALIHPATIEPFGMVIPEARARGVPVLTSISTGASELPFQGMMSLSVESPLTAWSETLNALINNPIANQGEIIWTWSDLAEFHIQDVYEKIIN